MSISGQWLQRGRKLHLQHGPIDLIVVIEGSQGARTAGFDAVGSTFDGLLERLVSQLDTLQSELGGNSGTGGCCAVAARMYCACQPYTAFRVTPMAAVAGSVADEMLDVIVTAAGTHTLRRAWVNNGGDIAVYLAPGEVFACAVVSNPTLYHARLTDDPTPTSVTLSYSDKIRGLATSGQHGRSLSLGIADSVTVLAASAAAADVAATIIANAVDIPGHQKIERQPACDVDLDSDLGERLVVTGVPALSRDECELALRPGLMLAQRLQQSGLIDSAFLSLQSHSCSIGEHSVHPHPEKRNRLTCVMPDEKNCA